MLIGCGPDSHHCPQCPLSVEAGLPGGGGGETTSLHGAVRRRQRLTHSRPRHRKSRGRVLICRRCSGDSGRWRRRTGPPTTKSRPGRSSEQSSFSLSPLPASASASISSAATSTMPSPTRTKSNS